MIETEREEKQLKLLIEREQLLVKRAEEREEREERGTVGIDCQASRQAISIDTNDRGRETAGAECSCPDTSALLGHQPKFLAPPNNPYSQASPIWSVGSIAQCPDTSALLGHQPKFLAPPNNPYSQASPIWKHGKTEVRFSLDEELAAVGEKEASLQVPRDHPFTMHTVGGQTMAVFSQGDKGIHEQQHQYKK
ncbi:hypothetical protein PAMA_003412 [Pampus argenteus]